MTWTGLLLMAALSPIVPFVGPSDTPSSEEVRAIVADLQAHGFDQFMVYPTTGLGYEYLGEGFFGMMDAFVDEAAARGMKVWLYDEFNWPSGTARGRVPSENEKFLYRELVAATNAAGDIRWETVVSRGINVDNDCLDGNNFEPDGVRRFMELTHHAYGRRYAQHLGSTIRGIFTDEPGNCSSALRLKVPEGTFLRIPTWSGMEEEYAAASGGRNFRTDCEKAYREGTLATSDIFRRWVEIRSARYRKSYFDPISAWCRTNGLESTGHLFQEEFADHCARINGLPLRTLKGLTKPAIDLVESDTPKRFDWLSLAFGQSAAIRSGKPGGAELMGLGPCDLTFAVMRKMYWICALHKLDTFFHAMYHTRGYRFLTKDSWAMFLSPAQPWYREAKLLNDAAREAAAWAAKPFRCDIALVYPQRQLGSYGFVGGAFPALRDACRELTWNGLTYDLMEEDETTDKPIVLDWDGETLFDRRSGTRFADLPAALAWLSAKTGDPLVPGHLRRTYLDGATVDVDLTSGRVAVSTQAVPKDGYASDLAETWRLKLDGPSKRRLWFWRSATGPKKQLPWEKDSTAPTVREVRDQEDDTCVLTADETLKGVRLVLRDYPSGRFSLLLDGRPIAFPKAPATSLVYSFNEICRESEPFDLASGRHVVKLVGGHDDKMFLPVAWIVGDFAEKTEGRLSSVPQTVPCGSLAANGLASFSGTAVYSTETVFARGDRLWIDSGDAVVRVKLGGRDLGARGWTPFEWTVPDDLCGRKLPLEIAVTTSVRPIFGSDASPDAKLNHVLWIRSSLKDPSPVGLNACRRVADAPTVMNIVNFVRGSEPRNPSMDLVTPLREEIALNTRHHLKNTILLQYDALLRPDLVAVAKSAEPGLTEYGVWIEMCRQLVEKVGLPWRGRKGWDWDWYINPGFLMAYTTDERARILDEVFRLFRETFGRDPESMGSWLLDAWSMDYVQRKYGVKAFCICREQDNTDAYGLRGGFFNGGYYPSKRNMLAAAVDRANAVRAPCFKMLTPDPIYNYSEESLTTPFGMKTGSAYTLEPVGRFGQRPEIVDWFFRTYLGPGALAFSYMQTGQENSFGWPRIGKGLPGQVERIAALRDAGRLRVEQLRETGLAFARAYQTTPPQAQVALEDWNGTGNQSVWYNSRFYRANLVNENGKLYLRDLHVMRDDFSEPFAETPCKGWQAEYFTPPVVDLYLANRGEAKKPVLFAGTCAGLAVVSAADGRLVVRADRTGDGPVAFRFDEASLTVEGCAVADFACGRNDFAFRGYRYSIDVRKDSDGVCLTFDGFLKEEGK